MTLSVGLPKQGITPGGHVGRLFIGDLGLPAALYEDLGVTAPKLQAFVTEVT